MSAVIVDTSHVENRTVSFILRVIITIVIMVIETISTSVNAGPVSLPIKNSNVHCEL